MIEFQGLDEILRELDNIDTANVENGLKKACALVEMAAKQKAPKGNGELRRSITSKVEDKEGIIFTPLEYAPYVEYGTGLFAEKGGRTDVPWRYKDDKGEWHITSGMEHRPYMRPALNENRERIKEIIKENLTHD